ncbi:hypothetical protein VC83_03827 [Pseudogymnoascus destructans]|uniref:gluconokinase n=2 Tax=Pseudogymnoascus destructans TaxID=655981 RepID=L8FRW0_PSED2|nr:uncharacterized protein VC83_03827 [Pseudogymnoascus destructans]ELR03587.1 hypothetical protein GMDG_06241 [Pseudogymnoascus destructans 20631-21]OAF59562.1 hypothetical protein VC83_03827 [Pseudogymnoascus destructans]
MLDIYNISAPAPGSIGREEDGTTHTVFNSTILESRRPNRRTKRYRTADMLPPSWDQPQVALPATPNIWVITGPSGAGKSRVGKYLCAKLGFIFVEGDDFLTKQEKANSGVVNDNRHAEILAAIIHEAISQASHGTAVVVACSALRVADRNAWRNATARANRSDIPAHRFRPTYYSSSFEDSTLPNHHGDNQVPYLQGSQDPYPHTIANDGFAYHSIPSNVLDIPAPTLRPIHLQFVYLAISKKLSLKTVKNRQTMTDHHVSVTAVPAQFRNLQPPEKWERDCFRQKSLEALELTVAVEKHVVMVGNGLKRCKCMFCP